MSSRLITRSTSIVGATMLAAATALAQPVINEKALPKGMTKADATTIATALLKSNADALAKSDADYDGALDAGGTLLAAVQRKAQSLVKTSADYRAFLTTQKTIASSKTADRATRLGQHYEKNKALLEKVYLLAGGSGTKDSEAVLQLLRKISPTVTRAGDKLLGYVNQAKPPVPRPSPPVTLTFSPPFAISTASTQEVGEQGIMEKTATVSPTTSAFALHAVAYQGDCSCGAFATTAVFVDVPAGKTRMSVRVPFQYSYTLHADAGDVRGAQARYLTFIDIKEISTNFTIMAGQGDRPPGPFEAHVSAYMTSVDLQDSGSAIHETPVEYPVVAGKRYLITICGAASASSVPAGFVSSDVSLTPTSFDIELK